MAKGSETVLLVEDQAELRAVARTILDPLGYTVLEAATKAESESRSRSIWAGQFTLMTDMVLPDGNGRHVARESADFHPTSECSMSLVCG